MQSRTNRPVVSRLLQAPIAYVGGVRRLLSMLCPGSMMEDLFDAEWRARTIDDDRSAISATLVLRTFLL